MYAYDYPCMRFQYSCVYGRTARVCVYAFRADADEQPVFACTLFVRKRMFSPVCVNGIRADADE